MHKALKFLIGFLLVPLFLLLLVLWPETTENALMVGFLLVISVGVGTVFMQI